MKKVDIKKAQAAIKLIATSEAAIRDTLNLWGPAIVEGVLAGDNIKHVNDLLAAFGGVRRKRLGNIVAKFLPYKRDKETGEFTEKDKNEKLAVKKLEAFEAFLASPDTFYGMLESAKKADKQEKTPAQILEAARKANLAALEAGFTFDQLLTMLNAVVAADAERVALAA